MRSKTLGLLAAGLLVGAQTASAAVVTIPLSDFLIFSGGGTTGADAGYETQIAGASLYIGNIGSNYDLTIGASETQVLGSVYVGGKFNMRAPGEIGTDGLSSFDLEPPMGTGAPGGAVTDPGVYTPLNVRVIANTGFFENSTALIYGTLDLAGGYTSGSATPGGTVVVASPATADTFGAITLTQNSFAGFATGGTDQSCTTAGCTSLIIDPNTLSTAYGTLDTAQDKDVYLRGGTYYFEDIATGGNLDLYIDVTNGPVTINVLDDATFGQDTELYVKGAGTEGQYVLIRNASQLASLIRWEIGDTFTLGGGTGNTGGWGSIFGGYVYSSGTGVGVSIGQHIDWYGALWAYDTVDLADHSRYNYVGNRSTPVPLPAAAWLLLSGLGGLGFLRKRKAG